MLRAAIAALLVCGSTAGIADSSAWKKDGITVCREYPAGVYRPYNVMRKFKLATAYFVNPALPEKSEIVNTYSLNDFATPVKADQLWESLQSGKVKIAAPVHGDSKAFAAIDAKDLSMLAALCPPTKPTVPDDRNKATVPYKGVVDFSNKATFQGSLIKLGSENLRNIVVISETSLPGVTPRDKYISWDPVETVNVNIGFLP